MTAPLDIATQLAEAAIEAAAEKAKGLAIDLAKDVLDEAVKALSKLFSPAVTVDAQTIGVTDLRTHKSQIATMPRADFDRSPAAAIRLADQRGTCRVIEADGTCSYTVTATRDNGS